MDNSESVDIGLEVVTKSRCPLVGSSASVTKNLTEHTVPMVTLRYS